MYAFSLFARHELNKLPSLVLHLRGGVNQHIPSPQAAGAFALPLAHRERPDAHLIEGYLRHLRITRRPVHVGPVAAEDYVSVEKGSVRLNNGMVGYCLWRHSVRDHALLCGESSNRLGAVYYHPVAVEDVASKDVRR